VSKWFPEKTNFIPHALPEDLFFPMKEEEIQDQRIGLIGPERKDHFVLFWVNRNARRKRPNDVLWAFAEFLDMLEEKHGHRNATLLMHTEPTDPEGPNLLTTARDLDIIDNIVFSNQRVDFEQMNVLHNISDACINIAYAEGFGLATLESMQCGNPIIALKTGGLTRQVVDHRDGSENGVALDVDFQSLVGSQAVPYIYEDYCSHKKAAEAIMKIHDMSPKERKALGEKARAYVMSEFHIDDTVDKWHNTLTDLIENWRENKPKQWSLQEVTGK
jgi:glycosyltransferase involved in cell wall biosynthesis